MPALRGFERPRERRRLGAEPVFAVETLHEPPAWTQLPGHLRKDLVLLAGSRVSRIGAGLAVVVLDKLVTAKEPESIADCRTAQIARRVLVLHALITGLDRAAWRWNRHGLSSQAGGLTEVRSVVGEPVAALPGDDVDDGALHV